MTDPRASLSDRHSATSNLMAGLALALLARPVWSKHERSLYPPKNLKGYSDNPDLDHFGFATAWCASPHSPTNRRLCHFRTIAVRIGVTGDKVVEFAYKKNPKAFFRLPVEPTVVDQVGLLRLLANSRNIEGVVYRPKDLNSGYPPTRHHIKNTRFVNVDFSSTIIHRFEFSDCSFSDSLFLSTRFSDCRFERCDFVRCNTYRIEFDKVYINPNSFRDSLNRFYHANIGAYLYQQLLANSQREFQTDFEFTARFSFGLWSRYQDQYNNDFILWHRNSFFRKATLFRRILLSRIFQLTMGFGVKWRNFALTVIITILITSLINYLFKDYFGLNKITSIVDAMYFTVITLSTVGFGDIAPECNPGKMAIASEALLGVFAFAALTSMLLRRLTG